MYQILTLVYQTLQQGTDTYFNVSSIALIYTKSYIALLNADITFNPSHIALVYYASYELHVFVSIF
jgi:hypothetical protein